MVGVRDFTERYRTNDNRECLCARISPLARDNGKENREHRVLGDGRLEQ
jgi:hypothetical protein